MIDNQIPNPNPPQNPNPPPSKSRVSGEPGHTGNHHYPDPPDAANPDAATLREQWNFAKRQYSRWYSQAWGSAILAGMAFFALGWVIKGGNPLPSLVKHGEKPNQEQKRHGDDVPSPPVPPPLTSSPRDAHEISKS
ncbi:Collagen alpha-1(XXVIII) chain like [Actinidia chinensis var. chinensis]|uniref:Collagen alpha-1(XXVIII) chain like n=1 Tax=Actinidia chinensis var. chinensis TaxID=1590841 RepID=A0A2R6QA91_ACTCC|nr:Collagen alpha-1(XXVIII) chain like [Actinidia chinensis var. chinensis]